MPLDFTRKCLFLDPLEGSFIPVSNIVVVVEISEVCSIWSNSWHDSGYYEFRWIYKWKSAGNCQVKSNKFYLITWYNSVYDFRYKTAYYSIVLPLRCAMYVAGIWSEIDHFNMEKIGLKIGEYLQIQDDYLDVYGDQSVFKFCSHFIKNLIYYSKCLKYRLQVRLVEI